VLTGLLVGILAQQAAAADLSVEIAARCAVDVHAAAGRQLAERHSTRGLLACELADAIPAAIDAVD